MRLGGNTMNLLIVLIISVIFAIAYMTGKFWVYDRCSESELSDGIKMFYILIDTFKDIAFLFCLLKFLLYGTL